MMEHEMIPVIFCTCGGSWHVTLWEGIIGEPVKVELVESVLRGADCCAFRIRLPRRTGK